MVRSARFSPSAGAWPRVAALPFAAAALCAGLSAPAQAQTAYSLTVLKPASTMAQADVSRSTRWVIDNSNRVVNDVACQVVSPAHQFLPGLVAQGPDRAD